MVVDPARSGALAPSTRLAVAAVVIMARYPSPGQVKTRLARRIGGEAAAVLYRAFLQDMATDLRSEAWDLVWAVTPPDADLRGVVGSAARQIAQRGSALAERMRNAYGDLFAAGYARVIMVGADAPHLGSQAVAEALAALETADVVLVPTRDGGYCLIALRAPCDLFTGIAMGGSEVCAQTAARAAACGLRVRFLDETFDVDEWADVLALRSLLAASQGG
ncbi:MAG: TIGR04282 family arsenosugar biosynthesis glycosyltransferase, partial [Candidatus Binatia bacterium]